MCFKWPVHICSAMTYMRATTVCRADSSLCVIWNEVVDVLVLDSEDNNSPAVDLRTEEPWCADLHIACTEGERSQPMSHSAVSPIDRLTEIVRLWQTRTEAHERWQLVVQQAAANCRRGGNDLPPANTCLSC